MRSITSRERIAFRALMMRLLPLTLAATLVAARTPAAQCAGDCSSDAIVTVDEIVSVVNIALGASPLSNCLAGDVDGSGDISVDEIVLAVNAALFGCPVMPTSTPTAVPDTPTMPTATASATVPGASSSTPTATATVSTSQLPAGPGLLSSISAARIASDPAGQIVVTFTLTDANGVPITPVLSAAQSAQQARVRFTIAHVEEYSGGGDLNKPFSRYVNDLNPTRPVFDSGGTLQTVDAAAGIYRYTFKAKLPANYVPTQTYSVGMQIDRTVDGQQIGVDPIFDFVPGGGTPQIRAATTTAQCNSCHAPLIAHGNRREVRLCTLCHTEAAVDPKGVSIDLRNMIHKIHRGKDLPSIVNGPPGSTYGIFSSFSQQATVFAQKDANGVVSGVGFPQAIQNCAVCHTDGPTAAFHRERPSVAACVACHDDINPSLVDTAAGPPGTKHFQGRGYADGDCAFCHVVDKGEEFDISVVGAHITPERSRQLEGLKVEITGLSNHNAGQSPIVSFKVTNNAGTVLRDLSGLNRIGFAIAGPTSDYASVLTPTAVGGGASGMLAGPDDGGVFQYTPPAGIPADATGTWSIGVEARRVVTLSVKQDITPKSANEAAVNQVATFTVDGSTAAIRRVVVEDQRCGSCHGEFSKDFSIHGNLRNQTEYCVLCHNPNNSDVARRKRDPAAVARGDAIGSIDFKVMIHKIHRGENLEQQPYLIYGFGPAPQNYAINNFGEVRFPGDLRKCETCHAKGTYLLPPFPGTALGTRRAHLDPATGNDVEDGRLGPITAVCTSCHDGTDAMAHAETQTAGHGEEACTVCHEEGRAFEVSTLHAGRR